MDTGNATIVTTIKPFGGPFDGTAQGALPIDSALLYLHEACRCSAALSGISKKARTSARRASASLCPNRINSQV
jgi:hypothetical protein